MKVEKVVTIGDVHAPHTDRKQLAEVLKYIKSEKPQIVFQMGDAFDMYSFSRYASSVNLHTPRQELTEGRAILEDMWRQIRKSVPRAKCYQLLGNHDDRVKKTLFSKAAELEDLVDLQSLWRFDGVETQKSSRDEIIIKVNGEDVVFQHGHRSRLGDHVRFNQMSTVVGHSHLGGVVFHKFKDKTLFELNAGFCADAESIPLAYTAQRISKSVPGFGVIDKYGPRFISL